MRQILLVLALAGTLAVPAAAQSDARYDPAWHGGLAAGALAGSTIVRLLERDDHPGCTWCGIDAQGQIDVPRLDAAARAHWKWTDRRRAATLSNVTAGVAYALPLIGLSAVHGGSGGEWGRDMLAAFSSVAVTQLTSDLTKRVTRRSRPHVAFDHDPIARPDDVHSFFSGHTATAFAAAVSTATIASRRDSRHAPWIWAGGLGLAGTTGYLRIAANRHFLTDVLTGAAVGTAFGVLLPRVFDGHGRSEAPGGATRAATPLLSAVGPLARLGRAPLGLQIGAGHGSLGIVGAVALR